MYGYDTWVRYCSWTQTALAAQLKILRSLHSEAKGGPTWLWKHTLIPPSRNVLNPTYPMWNIIHTKVSQDPIAGQSQIRRTLPTVVKIAILVTA